MNPIHTFESFLFENKKEDVVQRVVDDIAGNLRDDQEMTKPEVEKWLKGAEGKTAIESSLEALEDEDGFEDHGVKYQQIKSDVEKRLLSMDDIFAE